MFSFSDAVKVTKGLSFAVGVTQNDNLIVADLEKLIHLLVAGATGSGKSIFLNAIILNLIKNNDPSNLKFLLCDTKFLEFQQYNGIPHLLTPVITDISKMDMALRWLSDEIQRRLYLFSQKSVNNLTRYNDYMWTNFLKDAEMPEILVIIDDLTPLIEYSGIDTVQKILLNGRAAGVHIIASTQTPTWKKTKPVSNLFRSKILFSMSSAIEYRTLLGIRNIEPIASYGDALFSCEGSEPIKCKVIMPLEQDYKSFLADFRKLQDL